MNMRLVKLFVAAISCFLIGATQQDLDVQCFNSQPDDSSLFGASLAMSDTYLAVGDPGANKVVIFSKDYTGRWYREREIRNTTRIVPEGIDDNFGDNIAIHNNILAIKTVYEQSSDRAKILNLFKRKKNPFSPFGEYIENIYSVDLDKESSIELVGSYEQVISGNEQFIVSGRGIIFQNTYKTKTILDGLRFKKKPVSNLVFIPNKECIDCSTLRFSLPDKNQMPGRIASNDSFLIVNAVPYKGQSKAYLFDLSDLNKEPELISMNENGLYIIDVALSNKFMGLKILDVDDPSEYNYGRILIQNLENGDKREVQLKKDNHDFILDSTFLLAINPSDKEKISNFDLSGYFYFSDLSLYAVDKRNETKLIHQENPVTNALFKNEMLSVVKLSENNLNYLKTCIRKVHQ